MKKLPINVSEAQYEWLKAKAEELGISVTELIRRLIDKSRGVEI